jgi:peroxiredoxin
MLLPGRAWAGVVVALTIVVGIGCSSKTTSKTASQEKKAPPISWTTEQAAAEAAKKRDAEAKLHDKPTANKASTAKEEPKKPVPAVKIMQPPPPPTVAKVVLSDELRAGCLVKVGDAFPAGDFADTAGSLVVLNKLYGKKLTVVCFWTIGTTRRSQLVAASLLGDLTKELVEPFGLRGVSVIAINVGDSPQAIREVVAKSDIAFPCLVDPKGEHFAKVAKDKRMPRTFLLDASGKILWFDVEYSRESRRDLIQSIQAILGTRG